jgi:capsule polysaccharide export protein KpsE/RkpR
MKRDEASAIDEPTPVQAATPVWPPPSIGWLEVALPLWSRRWRLLFSALLAGLLSLGIGVLQPVRFVGHASFVVTPSQRPSQSVVASALPALAGLTPGGASAIDLHVAMLRSREMADRLIARFDLVRAWELVHPSQARRLLARNMDFNIARREGVVYIEVEDGHPQRAAAMANQAVEELRALLRGYALEEAKQRRGFYEAQLARARTALEAAQQQLQASGYDRAALRAEPRAAAEGYARQQAEIATAEVRLAALRGVRAEQSPEVVQARAEITALRAQLATMEAPRDEGRGAFVARVREFRYAEALVESLARQVEAARFDEDADPVPLQWLDRAQPAPWPAKPQPLLWLLGGLLLGFALQAVWVLLRHRARLLQQDAHYQQRLALVRSVLPARRVGVLQRLLARWRTRKGSA